MFSKNVSVTRPYCGAGFSIPVGPNTKGLRQLPLIKAEIYLVKTRFAPIPDAT